MENFQTVSETAFKGLDFLKSLKFVYNVRIEDLCCKDTFASRNSQQQKKENQKVRSSQETRICV